MLFSSHIFIFVFLPITFLTYVLLDRLGRDTWSIGWLVLASLFFYGWWNPPYVLLIVISVVVNFFLGTTLSKLSGRGETGKAKALLIAGLGLNLAVLGYYKYWNFLVANWDWMLGKSYKPIAIFLPLGISFFTFQKIAYLVDAYRQKTKEYDLTRFALFVTFFPQLISGPIVHHSEVMPQFQKRAAHRIQPELLACGLVLFAAGLFKKTVIADGMAPMADSAFALAAKGAALPLLQAWQGVLAYSMQIYFDFSGYSDMAVGLAWMFGITLPINFFSPYKAANISEFWRCWHMTLSRFLRDYLYIPLGGNRKGEPRRYVNLLVTMLLGGLWHGANWTFVIWGGLHGLYLTVNHLWIHRLERMGVSPGPHARLYWPSRIITFLAVIVAWVFFRANSLPAATRMLASMAGSKGLGELEWGWNPFYLLVAIAVAWFAPNTMEWLTADRTVAHPQVDASLVNYPSWMLWRPTRGWAIIMGIVTVVGVLYTVRDLNLESPFLYFQF